MQRHAIPDIDLRTRLAERGLECHLLLRELGKTPYAFSHELCLHLKTLLKAAYDRDVTEAHLEYETWAVVIGPSSGPPVACATIAFVAGGGPSCFMTRFEAVDPNLQRTGLGRLLYDCIAMWTRFLVFNDVIVQEGVASSNGQYFLVSCVDADPAEEADEDDCWDAGEDNVQGHGAFLRKLGFIRAQHDFGQSVEEIAFQREFHVPIEEAREEP